MKQISNKNHYTFIHLAIGGKLFGRNIINKTETHTKQAKLFDI